MRVCPVPSALAMSLRERPDESSTESSADPDHQRRDAEMSDFRPTSSQHLGIKGIFYIKEPFLYFYRSRLVGNRIMYSQINILFTTTTIVFSIL